MTLLHMEGVIIFSVFLVGLFNRSSSLGGSVAKASAAKESMIMLSQSIWILLIGDSPITKPQIIATSIATKFTVSWNWTNFLIAWNTFLP